MFKIIKNILFAVFLFGALSLCEDKNDCIETDYADSSSILVYKCRDGCKGVVPNCVPVCDNGCPANSRCQRPNICECNPGFVMDESNPDTLPSLKSCRSACEMPCPAHSHCASYNNCVCDDGYIPNNNTDVEPSLLSCKPACDLMCPSNSHCGTADDCVCDKGFLPDRINENAVPSLESCREVEEKGASTMKIVAYSLLVLSLVFIILAGIAILVIWVKRSDPDLEPPTYSVDFTRKH